MSLTNILFNPKKKETLPSHMTEERDKYYKKVYIFMSIAMLGSIMMFLESPYIEYMFYNTNSIPAFSVFLLMTITTIASFIFREKLANSKSKILKGYQKKLVAHSLIMVILLPFVTFTLTNLKDLERIFTIFVNYQSAIIEFRFDYAFHDYYKDLSPFELKFWPLIKSAIYILVPILLGAILNAIFNKHRNIIEKAGWVDWANDEDLKAMEARRQVGIEGGLLMPFGKWQGEKRKGQVVMMIETLSALCLAPPGTGKTQNLVIPTIIMGDRISLIINDPKPELYEKTGGHRQTVSEVYMLNWSKIDEIDLRNPINNKYYPRFNFLSPKLVPPLGPNRDTYIDSICKILIPTPKNGGDNDYFVQKGRAAMTGFMHYLLAKVGDGGDWSKLPNMYFNKEPSLPMLSDWMAAAQMDAMNDSGTPEYDTSYDPGGGDNGPADPLSKWIKSLVDDLDEKKSGKFKSPRAYNELANLVGTSDKERSGILGTFDAALLPFKNEAVKQRTEACDFTPDDMRGILDSKIEERTKLNPKHQDYLSPVKMPKGENEFDWASPTYRDLYMDKNNWKPLTLYMCINQAEAEAFANVTAMLYEVLSRQLISFGPYEYNEKTGRILGPFPVCFVLDEFAKLPKSESVMKGPDLGRSKKVSYMMVAQDYGQLELIYSKPDVEIINSTTAVKFILTQNNANTIKQIIDMVGKTTISRTSRSSQGGISKAANEWAFSESIQLEEVNFLRNQDVSAIAPDENLILVQNFLHRPMKLKSLIAWATPEISVKVRDRGKGPIATQQVPTKIKDQRDKQYKEDINTIEKNEKTNQVLDEEMYDPEPEDLDYIVEHF